MHLLREAMLKDRLSLFTIAGLVVVFGSLKFGFQQTNILSYDFFGLYLYLPATFIYHDPGISDLSWLNAINEQYNNTPMFYQLHPIGGYNIIRFFCGMALLLAPFFFLGHILALATPFAADGFSYPYQLAMMIGAFFYVLLGLVYTRKVLLHFFSDKITAITLVALFLGSNLFFYSTFDAGPPHVVLFSLYAMLLWFTIRWHEKPRKREAAVIGLLLGLIIVSRPAEIIAAAIPLLWGITGWDSFVAKVKLVFKHFHHILILGLVTFIIGIPQFAYYEYYTTYFYYNTYTDPQSSLDFQQPRFAWVLFSYRKGWLLYAPIMVFAIAGLFRMIQKKSSAAIPVFIHFAANLFLIASFTSLVSYGWRAFIQSYALMVIPLAYVVEWIIERKSKVLNRISLVLLLFFIWLSVFQSFQTMHGILHGSRMTKEYYWHIFGTMTPDADAEKLMLMDHYFDDNNPGVLPKYIDYKSFILQVLDFEAMEQAYKRFVVPDPENTGNAVFNLHPQMQFSPGVKVENAKISQSDHYWAEISFKVYSDAIPAIEELNLIVTYTYQGRKEHLRNKVYKYRAFPIHIETAGKWQSFTFRYLAPEATTPNDKLETYLWYRGNNSVLADDFVVKILEPVRN